MAVTNATYAELVERNSRIEIALRLLLDHIDYTHGACGLAEPVGGALPREIISRAHQALAS